MPARARSPSDAASGGASDEDLRAYTRRNALAALASLVALVAVVGLVGLRYQAEVEAATRWAHETLGVFGLSAVIFCADSVTAPIPPDLVLIVIAKSSLRELWWLIVPLLGVVSVVAGSAGWAIGRFLGDTRFGRALLSRFRRRHRDAVARYGRWAVALGALTPVPFSITCWTAGALHMSHRRFLPVSVLRIPRYVVYYLAIAYSDAILRLVV